MPTLIDLFAGAGGMTVGFAAEGFTPVYAVEFNVHAAATYAANFGKEHVFAGDIADVPDREVPSADVIIGGPPCQGFSNLGLRNLADPRNQLWREYARIVRKARPKVFVIENVDRFYASPEFQMLVAETDGGVLSDYTLTHAVLNAADYGVPQRRRRTIVIGSRIGPIELPSPTHAQSPLDGSALKPWTTVRDAIGHLPARPESADLPPDRFKAFGAELPGDFGELDIHFRRNPTKRSLLRYDHIPPGGGRFNLPEDLLPNCWRNKASGTTDVMGRMRWDAPSLTIRTEFFKPEKGQYLHPQWDPHNESNRVNRVITHYEASLLQDFPADYRWVGTKVEIARQIGNAVPSGLARAIARQVVRHL